MRSRLRSPITASRSVISGRPDSTSPRARASSTTGHRRAPAVWTLVSRSPCFPRRPPASGHSTVTTRRCSPCSVTDPTVDHRKLPRSEYRWDSDPRQLRPTELPHYRQSNLIRGVTTVSQRASSHSYPIVPPGRFWRRSPLRRSSRRTTDGLSGAASPVCTTSRRSESTWATRTNINAGAGYSGCSPIVRRRFGTQTLRTQCPGGRLIIREDESESYNGG